MLHQIQPQHVCLWASQHFRSTRHVISASMARTVNLSLDLELPTPLLSGVVLLSMPVDQALG